MSARVPWSHGWGHVHPCDRVSDEEQTLWVRRHRPDDVERLYRLFSPELERLARKLLDDPADALDVVHDVFARATLHASSYDPGKGRVWRWLASILRNACVDRNRAAERRLRLRTKACAGEARQISMERDVFALERIRAVLAGLPESHRALFVRAFREGESYPEIAARRSIALGTVKSCMARGLGAMRSALE